MVERVTETKNDLSNKYLDDKIQGKLEYISFHDKTLFLELDETNKDELIKHLKIY